MLADGLLQHIHIAHVGADQMIVLRGYDAEFLALRLFIRETVEPAARSEQAANRVVNIVHRWFI